MEDFMYEEETKFERVMGGIVEGVMKASFIVGAISFVLIFIINW